MLAIPEQQREIIERLAPMMKAAGFKLMAVQASVPFGFQKSDGNEVQQITIDISSDGYHYFSKMQVSHIHVEEVFLDVGVPNLDLTNYRNWDLIMMTLADNHNPLQYDPAKEPVRSESSFLRFVDDICIYLETYGFAFGRHYSVLDNVLTEMNRLEKEGKRWNKKTGLLLGGTDAFFRGLIISKLCNDADFDRKLQIIDRLVEGTSPDWHSYYGKLKQELDRLVPY